MVTSRFLKAGNEFTENLNLNFNKINLKVNKKWGKKLF